MEFFVWITYVKPGTALHSTLKVMRVSDDVTYYGYLEQSPAFLSLYPPFGPSE